MKSKLMKVLSLAMALTLVASLAACGGNGDDTTTTTAAPEGTTIEGVTPDEPTPDDPSVVEEPSATEAPTAVPTDPSGHTLAPVPTTAKPEPGKPSTPADNGMAAPKNAAEAMKMYNDALAKTKISGKMTKVNLDKAQAGNSTLNFNLKTVDGRVEPTFKSETTKKFNNKLFPINNATLKSASKSGDIITINFNLAPVNNVNAKYGDNGFAYFVTKNEAQDTVTTIIKTIGEAAEKLKIQVKSIDEIGLTGTMQVKIDAKTGKITTATYSFKETVKGKASAKIGLTVTLGIDIIGSGTCVYTGK